MIDDVYFNDVTKMVDDELKTALRFLIIGKISIPEPCPREIAQGAVTQATWDFVNKLEKLLEDQDN